MALWKWIVTDTWKFEKLSDWSNDNLEAMQARAEKFLGFIMQMQEQFPNINSIEDLEEIVRLILDKVVLGISPESQSSSTPVVVCEAEGKGAPKYQIS